MMQLVITTVAQILQLCLCRYPNQWYVASNMWGADLQQKLKAKILAKTGAPDPDHLKYCSHTTALSNAHIFT